SARPQGSSQDRVRGPPPHLAHRSCPRGRAAESFPWWLPHEWLQVSRSRSGRGCSCLAVASCALLDVESVPAPYRPLPPAAPPHPRATAEIDRLEVRQHAARCSQAAQEPIPLPPFSSSRPLRTKMYATCESAPHHPRRRRSSQPESKSRLSRPY